MRIAIIGGGIAGLAAAYELEKLRHSATPVDYELFEAGPRLGGVIASIVADGAASGKTVLELGPDSFLTEKPAAIELCRELGLGDDLVRSNDAERKTFILVKKRLIALPDGLMFLVPTKLLPTALTGLFSWPTKIRMGLELLHPPRPHTGDESVAALVKRHYGQEAVDRLADPLLSGIYGGDSSQLSAQTVLPRLVEMEAKYGSLTRGMLAGMQAAAEAKHAAVASGKVAEPRPLFTTLRNGLQQLVDAVVARLEASRLHLQSPIGGLSRVGAQWALAGAEGLFDSVIVATPAWAAAELLGAVDSTLADELSGIPYSSSITVNLLYEGAEFDALPPGFGFLVPVVEGRAMLACTFLHRKFPGRTAAGKTVLRAFLGGSRNAGLLAESDEFLTRLVRKELFEILQISVAPERVEITRWPRAMAQYAVGHKQRQARIQERLTGLSGLRLVGNAYDGIGISDCIRLGRAAARSLVSATTPVQTSVLT